MKIPFLLLSMFFFLGCSVLLPIDRQQAADQNTVYLPYATEESVLARHTPLFIVEDTSKEFNRIGSAVPIASEGGVPSITIDTDHPAVYGEEKNFTTAKGTYLNLMYRVHFTGVPFSLVPFYVTAGSGAGLLVIITLNKAGNPLLVSLVHTCGCFLAFIPTSYLDPGAFPFGWLTAGQTVYGISLPGLLDYGNTQVSKKNRLVLSVRSGTHRISEVRLETGLDGIFSNKKTEPLPLRPMEDLDHLTFAGGETSFFETRGPRKGYARNSLKPLEALLMSWWAFDPYIGQDKALGPREKTGVTFYTSLKLPDREASDMGDFAPFLRYWGWGL